jgi:hypothetical protein
MPETRHKRAARIIPGMVLESVGSSTLGMDEISLMVSGNLNGKRQSHRRLFNGATL